jgi:hypothetical protein
MDLKLSMLKKINKISLDYCTNFHRHLQYINKNR